MTPRFSHTRQLLSHKETLGMAKWFVSSNPPAVCMYKSEIKRYFPALFGLLRWGLQCHFHIWPVYATHKAIPIHLLDIVKSIPRDVDIFLDMSVIWTDFKNLVSPNNKICSRNIDFLSVRMRYFQSNPSVWHFSTSLYTHFTYRSLLWIEHPFGVRRGQNVEHFKTDIDFVSTGAILVSQTHF